MCKEEKPKVSKPVDFKRGLPPEVIDEAMDAIWKENPVMRLLTLQVEPYDTALHNWERESQAEIEDAGDALLGYVEKYLDQETRRNIESHICDLRSATMDLYLTLGFAAGLLVAGAPLETVKRLVGGVR